MREFINKNKKLLIVGLCVATIAPAIGTVFASENKVEPGFVEAEDGSMTYVFEKDVYATGWLELEEGSYYFDESGKMLSGWQTIGDYTYYFNEDGTMATGEIVIDNITYNLQNDGKLLKGFNFTNTAYYNDYGFQIKGWYMVNGHDVYFKEDGAMASSERVEIDGATFNFQEDGRVLIGWQRDQENEGEWYFYNNYGFKAYGWMEIDGEAYYFDDDAHMLYDTEFEGYKFDETGIATPIESKKDTSRTNITKESTKTNNDVADFAGGSGVYASAMAQLGRYQDCTMLVTNALAANGIYYHGWPSGYLSLGTVISASQAQPGDLIYYADGGMGMAHIAVYAGNGMAIHGGWNGNQTVLASAYVGSGPVFIRLR